MALMLDEFEGRVSVIVRPTVGRIVHYGMRGKECAAMITAVYSHDDGTEHVALHVFHPIDSDTKIINAPYSETLKDEHWTWPPRV